MKNYIYKILIASVAAILVFKLTIGKEISQINEKINTFSSSEGRKKILTSIKKEMAKANSKENYLNEEERALLRNFIKKIKTELDL